MFPGDLPYGWKFSRVENFVQFQIMPYLENFADINSTFHVYNFRVISHPRKTTSKFSTRTVYAIDILNYYSTDVIQISYNFHQPQIIEQVLTYTHF